MKYLKKPEGYDLFWKNIITTANQKPLNFELDEMINEETHSRQEFKLISFDDFEIYGFILRPLIKKNLYPLIVHFHGYLWHRGSIVEFLPLLKAGYAILSYDFRHQGGKSGQKINDCLFLNVNDIEHFYYRAALIDAIQILNVAKKIPDLNHQKMALNGFSQGAGVACLVYGHLKLGNALCIDAPGMTNYDCRYKLKAGATSYFDEYAQKNNMTISSFLKTHYYFDVLFIAGQVDVPVLLSSSRNDPVCPFECFKEAYQLFKGHKEIVFYPSNEHDDGGYAQLEKKILFLNKILDC
jgi:cephalosporin-C deacetylase